MRSDHPFAGAVAGPQAEGITSGPLPLPPHIPESPVGRVHELDGQVLLLGVNHDAETTLHLAELLAGVPYRVQNHCTVLQDGRPVRIDYGENDHCCARFKLADEWLRTRGLQAEGEVGYAHADSPAPGISSPSRSNTSLATRSCSSILRRRDAPSATRRGGVLPLDRGPSS